MNQDVLQSNSESAARAIKSALYSTSTPPAAIFCPGFTTGSVSLPFFPFAFFLGICWTKQYKYGPKLNSFAQFVWQSNCCQLDSHSTITIQKPLGLGQGTVFDFLSERKWLQKKENQWRILTQWGSVTSCWEECTVSGWRSLLQSKVRSLFQSLSKIWSFLGWFTFCRGRDLIGQGHSGTGKSLALVIGCLQQIDFHVHYCQALILCPTRELATQMQKLVNSIGEYCGVRSALNIGGLSVRAGNWSLITLICRHQRSFRGRTGSHRHSWTCTRHDSTQSFKYKICQIFLYRWSRQPP